MDDQPTPALSAAERVADVLASEILGGMSAGSKLPSEAEMATRFGVSRVTMREAVKTLAGRGLLEVSRGKRATVCAPNGRALGDFLSWIVDYDPKGRFDLVEVRLSLEVQSVALAAQYASRSAVAAIESALMGMQEAAVLIENDDSNMAAEQQFHHFDVGFHEAIALAGGNRVLASLIEAISPTLEKTLYMSRRGRALRGLAVAHTVEAHRRILDRITARDVDGAAQAMRAHLTEAGRDMRAAFDAVQTPHVTSPPRRMS